METKKNTKTDYNTLFYQDLREFCKNSKNALKVCSLYENTKNNYHQNIEALKIQYRLREILETTGNIDTALQELQEYVEVQKKKWLLFQDAETGQHMLVKYKNRFSQAYIVETRRKLQFLQKLPENYLLHWTLTIPNSDIRSFFQEYRLLKDSFYRWIKQLKKLYMQKFNINIQYIVTYETTVRKEQLHQHLHCIILGIHYVPYSIFIQMKNLWSRLTGSQYDHLTIPRQKENVFRYVMKYITKEISCVNYTSMFLFLVKGKAFTMSESLSELFEGEHGLLPQHRYIYIGTFLFDDIHNPIFIFDRYGIDPANRTYVLSCYDPSLIKQWSEQYEKAIQEYRKMQEVEKKSEEMRSRVQYIKISKPTEEKKEKSVDIEKIYEQMPKPHRPSFI